MIICNLYDQYLEQIYIWSKNEMLVSKFKFQMNNFGQRYSSISNFCYFILPPDYIYLRTLVTSYFADLHYSVFIGHYL